MAQDFYELLEVPDNASEVWIRRAYHRQREMLEQDTTLGEDRRQSRIAAVEDAFSILSNPSTRQMYDRDHLKLPELEPSKAKSVGLTSARLTVWGIVALLLIGATWAYWRYAKEDERVRLEQERGSAEVAARLIDIEARDKAQRTEIEKIASNVERQRQAGQSAGRARPNLASPEDGKSEDDDVKREMASIDAERARVAQERRNEVSKRLR